MKKLYSLFAVVVLLFSCQSPLVPEEEKDEEAKGNLIVSVFQLEQTPFSFITRLTSTETCTRLNYAVYTTEGVRVKQINQKLGDVGFGATSFKLAEGTYQLVVVAHSCNGNPTMTNPSKIQFTNSLGYTDTFLCSEVITIGDEPVELNLTLDRIVALCRFVFTDDYPRDVTKMLFVYKGGSGAFDASTGLGCVNSTQTVSFDVTAGQKQFDLYTFLHDTEGTIHLTVTALDDDDNELYNREFDVPLIRNYITWFTGNYFTGGNAGTSTMTININTDWAGEYHLIF